MTTALHRELKKGDDSRVAQVGDDRWKLVPGAEEPAAKTKKTTKKTAGKKTAEKTAEKKATTKKSAGKKTAEKKATEKKTTKKAAGKKTAEKKATDKKAGKKTTEKKTAEKKTTEKKAAADKKAGKKTTEKKTAEKKTAKKKATEKTAKKTAGKKKAAAAAETLAPAEDTQPLEAVEAQVSEVVEAQVSEAVEARVSEAVEAGTAEAEAERPARKGRRRKSRRSRRGGGGKAAAPEITPVADEASVEVAEVLAPKEQPLRAVPADTPAEDDIEALYGDELSGVEPGAAFAEYRDEQTDDEDRPMTPEIVASRRERPKRERRRRRRDRTERGRGEARPVEPRADRERAPAPRAEEAAAVPAEVADMPPAVIAAPAWSRPGNALGQAAAEVLRESNAGQPVRAKQIAQMMHKQGFLGGDPDQLWPHVKAALISDEKAHLARGMRPPVEYRGRDLFALTPEPAIPELVYADESVASAIEAMATLTHAALKARLSTLDLSALERVAHVYLVRQGWQNIEWIKRVQRSAYAVAQAPDGLGTVLVGVRAGEQPVDRRGVGELRVGIQAKKLPAGLLLAPQGLSDIARQELRKSGPSISVLVGDAFVSALIHSGVGVRSGHVPVAFVDDTFFREVAFD